MKLEKQRNYVLCIYVWAWSSATIMDKVENSSKSPFAIQKRKMFDISIQSANYRSIIIETDDQGI